MIESNKLSSTINIQPINRQNLIIETNLTFSIKNSPSNVEQCDLPELLIPEKNDLKQDWKTSIKNIFETKLN